MDDYEKSKANTTRHKKLVKLLKTTFGYGSFRPNQYEVINKIINKEDVCLIAITSYGKSLTFQLPALYLSKPAVIISPLISLMEDQRLILNRLKITSCCYNSNVTNKYQLKKEILENKYQFIYITPESIVELKEFLSGLNDALGISLIAIDEAHCISAYGHDFRPAYRKLTFFKELLPDVPLLAVTATATELVGKDICKVLSLKSKPIKTSFDRDNLYLEVRQKSKKFTEDIIPIVKLYPKESIIIYCLTKKETEKIAAGLRAVKIKCGMYHSGIDTEKKSKTHSEFIENKCKIVVATIAFGMGINKPDVRVVVHYGSPRNIEGYYQEIGRAGRDGLKSYCYAFFSNSDFKIQERFIQNCENELYKKNQMSLLSTMKNYMTTDKCRRQLLLKYFDEEYGDDCQNCDNCIGVNKMSKTATLQNITKQAKMLIELIESVKDRKYGIAKYIGILRGSKTKETSKYADSMYFGKGSKKSIAWWKELYEKLVENKLMQNIYLKGGRFPMSIVSVTQNGIAWANQIELGDLLDGFDVVGLKSINMQNIN